jgi:Phage P2 GpE
MADVAMVLHVPLAEMAVMSVPELMRWHDRAMSRWRLLCELRAPVW